MSWAVAWSRGEGCCLNTDPAGARVGRACPGSAPDRSAMGAAPSGPPCSLPIGPMGNASRTVRRKTPTSSPPPGGSEELTVGRDCEKHINLQSVHFTAAAPGSGQSSCELAGFVLRGLARARAHFLHLARCGPDRYLGVLLVMRQSLWALDGLDCLGKLGAVHSPS